MGKAAEIPGNPAAACGYIISC